MSAGQLAAILSAAAALVTAVTALLHSIQTRKQVSNPPVTVNAPNGGSKSAS